MLPDALKNSDQENAAWIFGARPAAVIGGGLLLLLLAAALLAIGQRDDTGTIVMLSFCAAPLGLLVLAHRDRPVHRPRGRQRGGEKGGASLRGRGGAPRLLDSSLCRNRPNATRLFLAGLTAAGMAPGSWAVSPTGGHRGP